MRLTISLLSFLIFFGVIRSSSASESSGDCKTAASTLRAGIESRPDDTLIFFDDAIKSSPECVRLLMTTAIEVARPDEALLTQMIHVAMTEYPEKQNLVAEVAMGAMPESALAIREAFVSAGNSSSAPAETRAEAGNKLSPVDRFLGGGGVQEEEEENFSPLSVDANEGVVRAIASLSTQVGLGTQVIDKGFAFQFSRPDSIIVGDVTGDVDETTLRDSSPVDTTDETIFEGDPILLSFLDEGATAPKRITEVVPVESGQVASEELVENESKTETIRLVSIPANSSIYFIPTAGGEDFAVSERNNIVLRSTPAAPTMPRLR